MTIKQRIVSPVLRYWCLRDEEQFYLPLDCGPDCPGTHDDFPSIYQTSHRMRKRKTWICPNGVGTEDEHAFLSRQEFLAHRHEECI